MRIAALTMLALTMAPASLAETLATRHVCDLPTDMPADPSLDADATLGKAELPMMQGDIYASRRLGRRQDVEVYAGTIGIDPNDGRVQPDFTVRDVHPFDPPAPDTSGTLSAQSPAIPCE